MNYICLGYYGKGKFDGMTESDMWPAVNTATKYVASNTMTSHERQPSVFLSGDIAEKITKIKQQEGPDLIRRARLCCRPPTRGQEQ